LRLRQPPHKRSIDIESSPFLHGLAADFHNCSGGALRAVFDLPAGSRPRAAMATWSTVPPAALSPALSPHGDLFLPDSYHPSLSSSPHASVAVYTPDQGSSFDHQSSLNVQGFLIDPGLVQLNDGVSMTEDVNSRGRNMSQSSTEREMSTDVKPSRKDSTADPETEARGVKRKFTSDLDYPRRRATIAVCVRSNLKFILASARQLHNVARQYFTTQRP
jgi:hypothetical protein